MGTEYYLYNHSNATYYELGKGPWYLLDDILFQDEGHIYNFLLEEWDSFQEDKKIEYFKALAKDLIKFKGDAKTECLKVFGDGGDENLYACSLGYKCTGTRFCLLDPVENKRLIEEINKNSERFIDCLGSRQIESLEDEGWNIKNYVRE